jgi:dienelactone hydrolase
MTVRREDGGGAEFLPNRTPRLQVDPMQGMIDEEVNIRVLGCSRGQLVTLGMSWRATPYGVFRASATFAADELGAIDVRTQRPLSGTYDISDAMGLFWSMEWSEQPLSAPVADYDPLDPAYMQLHAAIDGTTLGSVQLERRWRAPYVRRHHIRDEGLVGSLLLPEGEGPFPALVILGSSYSDLRTPLAGMLASHGYATLALAYFGVDPLPAELVEIPLEYFARAIAWLHRQEAIEPDRLGLVGVGRGGELALLLGTAFPVIRVVVSYVGSGYMHCGYGFPGMYDRAAWTLRGNPLPYYEQGDPDAAMIPVEHIKGAVLLISGQDDQTWESSTLSDAARVRLEQHNHSSPYEHISYGGAGHLIRFPYQPTTVSGFIHPLSGLPVYFGGNPKDTAFACADSWRRVLGFLNRHL